MCGTRLAPASLMSSMRPDSAPSIQPPPVPRPPDTAGALVLVVGEVHSAIGVARKELERHGYNTCIARSLGDAVASIAASTPAVVVIDMELADGGALALCQQLKRDSATRLIPLVLLHDASARQHRIDGINAGADAFLTKPVDPEELLVRVRACARTSQFTTDLDSAASIIMTLTAMLEARECSPGHCYRMANYAMALARALRLSDADRQTLYRGAFLHDIGMLAIPDVILRKGGRLEPDEYEIVKSHPVIGDALCANLRTLHPVRPIVRHHHERLDGSGYPDRLSGTDVPLLAQIVGIVDVFEAVTMGRAYVAPRSAADAFCVLRQEVKLGWRGPDLVEAFVSVVRQGSLGNAHGADADASGADEVPESVRVPAVSLGSLLTESDAQSWEWHRS